MSIAISQDSAELDLPPRLTPTQRAIITTLLSDGGEISSGARSAITELGDRIEIRSLDTLRMNLKRLERARLIECEPARRPKAIRLTALGRRETDVVGQ